MKLYHFVIIFLLFFLFAIIKTDISIGDIKEVTNEKELMQSSLDTATSDAINFLASSETYGSNAINKDGIISTFFNSFYSSMGIISDKNAQIEIQNYIPVILLCDSDGYFVYYYDQYIDGDGTKRIERRWSEKMPYYYEDDYFTYRFTLTDKIVINDLHKLFDDNLNVIEVDYHEFQTNDIYKNFRDSHSKWFVLNEETYEITKKIAIINRLEEVLSYYTSQYNLIASQNGITYNFSFPAGQTEEWAKYMDDINMVVVFQGYPYGRNKNYTFNKISSASSNIFKKPLYYIEKKSWYYLAHKADCPMLINNANVLDEPLDSLEECAKKGAFCDTCIEHGSRVPKIDN